MRRDNIILLVEDNADDEALTLRALQKHHLGNDVVVTRDGEEALEFLFGFGCFVTRDMLHRPQVVLLDLKLPKIDGLEVLRRIRDVERTRILFVVVLTSSNEQRDIIQAYGLGTNSYVRKPVNFNEFVEAVGQLGLYWFLVNAAPPRVYLLPIQLAMPARQTRREPNKEEQKTRSSFALTAGGQRRSDMSRARFYF